MSRFWSSEHFWSTTIGPEHSSGW